MSYLILVKYALFWYRSASYTWDRGASYTSPQTQSKVTGIKADMLRYGDIVGHQSLRPTCCQPTRYGDFAGCQSLRLTYCQPTRYGDFAGYQSSGRHVVSQQGMGTSQVVSRSS